MNHLIKISLALLLATCLSLFTAHAKQVTVTIGEGTSTSNYVPYGNSYRNSTTQIIYTQAELGSVAGPITSLAFDVATKSYNATTSLKIYIGKSKTTTFASTSDYRDVSGLTLVYDGAPTLGKAQGWEEIELQTPYHYDGKSNLVIVIGRQSSSYSNSLKYNTTSSTNRCLRRGNNSKPEAGDPTDTSVAYSRQSVRPNLQLLIGEDELVVKDGITYKIKNGEAIVKSCLTTLSGAVTIQSKVTSGGTTYNVKRIADGAFANCSILTSITIPASVTEIRSDAFKGCTSITTISFSDSETPITLGATYIENQSSYYYCGIFEDCPVETVYLGRDVTYSDTYYLSPFQSKTTLTKITLGPKITTLRENLFNGCTRVTELTIPANVITVEKSALYYLLGLKELTIEDSETALDLPTDASLFGMFRSSGIEKLYLGRNVNFCTEETSTGAFNNCSKLAEVTIGKKVTELGDNMFYNCTKLKTVYNKSNYFTVTAGDKGNGYVAYYAETAMNGDNFAQTGDFLYYEKNGNQTIYKYVGTKTDVVVPAGYLLESKLFIGRNDLTSITFSQGHKRIPRACMEQCTALTSVTLPSTIEEIDDFAFFGCTALTSISLPTGLKRLGAHSLQMCSALTSVNIPSGITQLEDFSLSRTGLTSISIPESVTRIEGGVFLCCRNLEQINLPEKLTCIGPFAFKYCTALKQIEIPAGVDSIPTHCFYNCPKMTEVKLHEGLKSINDFAFYRSGICEINLPNTLQKIGQYGLALNSFDHLTLPKNLAELQTGALYGNSKLKSIAIPNGITELKDRVLCSCTNLHSITLPETMTTIGRMALYDVPLMNINWPSSLTTLGYQSLGGKYSNGIHIIPASISEVDCMIFEDVDDGNDYFCFSPQILPENVFLEKVLLHSTLYVLPELVEQYRNSSLIKRFKAILPIGDTNRDGKLSIADVTNEICFVNKYNSINYINKTIGKYNVNGDEFINSEDINALHQSLLCPHTTSQATQMHSIANIVPIDIATEPSENCRLIKVTGYMENDGPAALDLINHIRWEVCLEGASIGSSGSGHLSMESFHPYTWSTDLEHIARVRAVEGYFTRYHQRLNGKSLYTVESNGLNVYGECLAFSSSFLDQMTNYYAEKEYWILKDFSHETGHYSAMISPSNKYIGMAGFSGTASLEYASSEEAGNMTEFLPPTGKQTFYVDVRNSYITDYEWYGNYNGSRIKNDFTMKTGEYLSLWYAPLMEFVNQVGQHRGFYVTDPEISYTSSNPDVAIIDPDKNRVISLNTGVTTITATSDQVTSQITITVTCNHELEETSDPANNKASFICTRCGEEFEYELPTSFYITFWRINWGSNYPDSSYTVGNTIKVDYNFTGGSDDTRQLIIENDHPELLDTPINAENSTSWLVLGAGDVNLKVYLKYNPKVYRTYKLHLVEPEQ